MSWLVDIIKKGLPIAAVAVIGYLGETGKDGGFIKDVWAGAKTASPFAAMFAVLAWLSERRERQEAQRQCNERTVDFINSTNAAANLFDRALDKLMARRRGHNRGGRR